MKETLEGMSTVEELSQTKKRGRPIGDRAGLTEREIIKLDQHRYFSAQSRLRKKTGEVFKFESIAKTENYTLAEFEEDDLFDQSIVSQTSTNKASITLPVTSQASLLLDEQQGLLSNIAALKLQHDQLTIECSQLFQISKNKNLENSAEVEKLRIEVDGLTALKKDINYDLFQAGETRRSITKEIVRLNSEVVELNQRHALTSDAANLEVQKLLADHSLMSMAEKETGYLYLLLLVCPYICIK